VRVSSQRRKALSWTDAEDGDDDDAFDGCRGGAALAFGARRRATARAASVMPWPERDARMWQVVFPQMADWLPDDEATQLRFEFMQEIERLRAA
jgi:hypothetical protein